MFQFNYRHIVQFAAFVMLAVFASAICRGATAQTTVIEIEDEYNLEGFSSTSSRQDFFFYINITGTINSPIMLNWHTENFSAKAAEGDYVSNTGTLEIMPGDEHLTGQDRKKITIEVINDNEFEEDETFKVVVATDSNLVTISNEGGIAVGHIQNEDGTYVSINTIEKKDDTILLQFSFEPPLRYHNAAALSDQSYRVLPLHIQKNSNIKFADQIAWNEGGKNVFDLEIYDPKSYTEDPEQNRILGIEKSKVYTFKYEGDQGHINFRIDKGKFFNPDTSNDNLPVISNGTSCATRSNCTVTLGVPQVSNIESSFSREFWITLWLLQGIKAFGLIVAIILAIVGYNLAIKLNKRSTDKMDEVSKENSDSINKVVVSSSDNITQTLSHEIQSSSKVISSKIDSSSTNLVSALDKLGDH